MTGSVLVVGDVMTDVIVIPEGPIAKGSDRRATVRSRSGGSGANQAVWLGAMDANVVFAARVGAADKAMYENYFRGLGVVPVLAGDREQPSGVLVTIVDPDGERSFFTDRGANLNLSSDDLPADLLDDVAMVMVSGYSFFAPGPRAAVQGLCAAARDDGEPGPFHGRPDVALPPRPDLAGPELECGTAHDRSPLLVLTRSMARSRTEAARGLSAISSGPALSAPRVTRRSAGSWPAGTNGRSSGTVLLVAAVKACFTSRSSSEW